MGLKKALLLLGVKSFGKNVGKGKLSAKKLTGIAVAAIAVGLVGFIIIVIITVLIIRWAWNSGNNAVQQNPTISSVVETTKQEVSDILPSVPSSANDFITNNQVDTAKLTETYTSLPSQTQEVWKAAMEKSIADTIQSATSADVAALQQLLTAVRGL